jgi:4-alpha-glucanotransferase
MKIHFKLPYFTHWGQRLMVSGSIPELGNYEITKALALNYHSPEDWTAEIEVNRKEAFQLNYKYILLNELNGRITEEWGDDRFSEIDPTKTDKDSSIVKSYFYNLKQKDFKHKNLKIVAFVYKSSNNEVLQAEDEKVK